MILVTDIGNSRTKVAVYEYDKIVYQQAFDFDKNEENFENIFKIFPKISNWVLSSVKNDDKVTNLAPARIQKHIINHQSLFPFKNNYATPDTLGMDRMVLASGATLMYPNTNRLVIDAGTCITYDWINDKEEYLGGGISPGLSMRYKSLNVFTDKLPLLKPNYPQSLVGNSTNESMYAGTTLGIVAEIDYFINEFTSRHKNFTIILTGGDTDFLAKRLKNTIFAHSNFLIESLYRIFQFNIHNG